MLLLMEVKSNSNIKHGLQTNEVFSLTEAQHIIVNRQKKQHFTLVSPIHLHQKWKSIVIILRYKHLVHNKFQIIPCNYFKYVSVSKFLYRNNLHTTGSLQACLGLIYYSQDIYYQFHYLPNLFAKNKVKQLRVWHFHLEGTSVHP